MEVLYRVYVGAIFGAIALAVLAGARPRCPRRAPTAVDEIADHGPALLGARRRPGDSRRTAVGGPRRTAGDRGRRGPVRAAGAGRSRRTALRPAALRQLRIAALAGAVLGAVAGNFAFRRLPGSPVEWIACLALFGALVPLCILGCALLASGRRLRPPVCRGDRRCPARLVASPTCLLGLTTSPATMLGDSGDAAAAGRRRRGPRRWRESRSPSPRCSLGLACAGSGLSLEAARRRATLTAQLRFSASVQDLRTVVLLRRQLASERPRRRPWLQAARRRPWRGARSGGAAGRASCAGRRPASAGSSRSASSPGAIAVGAWSGTTPLVALRRRRSCWSPRSTWSSRWPRRSTIRCGAICCRSSRTR